MQRYKFHTTIKKIHNNSYSSFLQVISHNHNVLQAELSPNSVTVYKGKCSEKSIG